MTPDTLHTVPQRAMQAAPPAVRVRLDDESFARSLPAVSDGGVAIFIDRLQAAHVIRKVLLRQGDHERGQPVPSTTGQEAEHEIRSRNRL